MIDAPCVEEAAHRATLMTRLPEGDRNVMIALGILAGTVIDARQRFDRDFIGLDLCGSGCVTTTVFEGVFGPGEGDVA